MLAFLAPSSDAYICCRVSPVFNTDFCIEPADSESDNVFDSIDTLNKTA